MVPKRWDTRCGVVYLTLRESVLDLVDLDLTESFDLRKTSPRCCMYARDGIVAIGLELRDVHCADAVCLDCIDIDNEAFLLRY
jgi:hypothetical protein